MKKVVLRSAVIGLCMLLLCLLAGCSLKLRKKHSYVNGVCQDCGEKLKESEGLDYELSSDGTYYTVTGIGTCKDRDVLIPATYNGKPVTGIGDFAFGDCKNLESITIPDSVTSIGDRAFSGTAYYDNSVNWENGVLYIGNHLIKAEDSLSGSYSIKAGTKCIADGAFNDCKNFKSITIPESVTSIGEGAFVGCSSLTSITIPDSVTGIGDRAFSGTAYYDNSVNWENGVLYIGNHLIKAEDSLSGSYSIKAGTKCIAGGAFSYCSSLADITIPKSVTCIGELAFRNCTNLTAITVSDQNTTYHSVGNCLIHRESKTLIAGCQTSIIPTDGSVTSIGEEAFSGCRSLTSITIPSSVTSIGVDAFGNCKNLTSITIPDSVTSIGEEAFRSCSSLASIVIPDGVTSIGVGAFYNTAYYKNSANWENGVLYIGNHLIKAEDSLLGSYSIKAGTKCIAGGAFFYCSSLTNITIPESVTCIGELAFRNCTNLTAITVSDQNPIYHSAGNCLIHTESKTLIAGCQTSVIPTDGSVTSIGEKAFSGCRSLTSITIPDSVTSIGQGAFSNCWNLAGITIPDSVTSIANGAFSYCKSLTSITIPDSVTSIGAHAFFGCSSLTSITIPDGVTSIGKKAFSGCGLTSITIPNSVTSIGKGVFSECTDLTSITVSDQNTTYHSAGNCLIHTKSKTLIAACQTGVIPADGSVTSIGEEAFYGCSSLTSIAIPDSVTSIGQGAFSNCSSLTSIAIPDSVTSIGQGGVLRLQ